MALFFTICTIVVTSFFMFGCGDDDDYSIIQTVPPSNIAERIEASCESGEADNYIVALAAEVVAGDTKAWMVVCADHSVHEVPASE